MWKTKRTRKPERVTSPYGAYARGRMRSACLLDDVTAAVYLGDDQPMSHRVAFVLGALAECDAPLLSEVDLLREVTLRLKPEDPASDTSSGGTTPPAAPPPAVPVAMTGGEETERVRPARWIGDPLPATGD